ncbi:MAG: hypothetical protein LBU85_01325 [Treponema sp.]|nr:hypothetical protein [Treponema sp.]
MEIAKFVLTAIGTFISVLALSFTVFQYWRKKQDEKFAELRNETKNSIARLGERLGTIEQSFIRSFEGRLGVIEGELKGIKPILQSIQNWFVNNTPTGR